MNRKGHNLYFINRDKGYYLYEELYNLHTIQQNKYISFIPGSRISLQNIEQFKIIMNDLLVKFKIYDDNYFLNKDFIEETSIEHGNLIFMMSRFTSTFVYIQLI